MSTEPETETKPPWSPWALAAAALMLVMLGVLGIGTWRGCLFVDPKVAAEREEARKKEQEEEKKRKQEFEISPPAVQPSDAKSPAQFVKPGHWATATQKMRANYRDFVGDSRTVIIDKDNNPAPIPSTPFVLRASRPVALSKGRPKAIESTMFVPQSKEEIRLAMELAEHGLGYPIDQGAIKLTSMPSYQYHFVVLAKEPSRYAYIKSLDSVHVPWDGESDADDTEDSIHYRVVTMDVGQSVGLSDNPLTWTSIAYILWDEVDPEPFTPEQEQAFIDWLEWGGQLIVSGPDSLDLLKGSFLDPYLPADNEGSRAIVAADLEELNQNWLISTKAVPGEPVTPTAPWSGVKLTPRSGSEVLPGTGGLLVERQVGRGRVVVSAMQLAERDLINWRNGFESLVNACLLRRPQREYCKGFFGDTTLAWADKDLSERRLDARLTTNLRYFARDLGVNTAYRFAEVTDPALQGSARYQPGGQIQPLKEYRPPENAGGIGSWNDFSSTATAARQALREAAGVEVPGSDFVVVSLVAYLIALVPLNWLVFHTLRRVEWAWIAAPIIAIAGTFIIVHRAQLDIGFVRAQTEIGLLEQQPDHARAHLTRFTALYTSLSTTYDFDFDNITTLAAPFSTGADFQMMHRQGLLNVDYQRADTVRLNGLPVSSNSTSMVHSEQMFPLKGVIRLGHSTARGSDQIENHTQFDLHSVAVVRRWTREKEEEKGQPGWEGMWIGNMIPNQSTRIAYVPLQFVADKVPFADERAAEEKLETEKQLRLEPLFKLAYDPAQLEPGEVRLVARIDEPFPGEIVVPAASQLKSATVVVAHLAYGPLLPPKPDNNTKRDIKADKDEPLSERAELEAMN